MRWQPAPRWLGSDGVHGGRLAENTALFALAMIAKCAAAARCAAIPPLAVAALGMVIANHDLGAKRPYVAGAKPTLATKPIA